MSSAEVLSPPEAGPADARRVLHSLFDLVAPAGCLVCDRRGEWLCGNCENGLTYRYRRTATGLTVVAAAGREFLPAITRWKDGGIRAATPVLASRLTGGVARLGISPAAVVPVPSRVAAKARRGWQPTAELGSWVAAQLGVELLPLLEFVRQPVDQRGLTDAQRQSNLAGSLIARTGSGELLLVDDVMTGGSTLAAAHAALSRAGCGVVAAAVLAASRHRTS